MSLAIQTGSGSAAPDALRAAFQKRLDALRSAAKEWGVQADHPEGVFISTMIGTQEGFAELALDLAEKLKALLDQSKALTQEELAKQRLALQETHRALEIAKFSVNQLEIEKDKVATKMIAEATPRMIEAVGKAMVIRELRLNKEWMWRRAFGIAGIMLALVMSGYGWGRWSYRDATGRLEDIGAAIAHCEYRSQWTDDQGHRLCQLDWFKRPQ